MKNVELALFELSTGDTVSTDDMRYLKSQGLIESEKKIINAQYKAKLTPKGDKLVRAKLMAE